MLEFLNRFDRFGDLPTSANYIDISILRELTDKVFDQFNPEELLEKAQDMTVKDIRKWKKE